VDAVNADNPAFAWQATTATRERGRRQLHRHPCRHGQEAGGGEQGAFSIWSHASAIDYPAGKLACAAGLGGLPRPRHLRP